VVTKTACQQLHTQRTLLPNSKGPNVFHAKREKLLSKENTEINKIIKLLLKIIHAEGLMK